VADEIRFPDEWSEAVVVEPYCDDRITMRMFEVTVHGLVPVPLAPSRACRGRSRARQPRQRPRGAGRPRVRRTPSASRASPDSDSDSPAPGDAGPLVTRSAPHWRWADPWAWWAS
jgi:hypothetical protein